MLRIRTIAGPAAAKAYYTTPDYYIDGEELPGSWHGRFAEQLGLAGQVRLEDFFALCDNRHPQTGLPLTAARRADRDVGRDFTFSVPKSVSLAAFAGGDERILPAVIAAANETLADIEQEVQTRVRQNGRNEERATGNMLWALFPHRTSRPVDGRVDPQLHLHGVVFSLTDDTEENQYKSIHFRDIQRQAPLWQGSFRARLALALQELGYELRYSPKDFEIDLPGFDARALREFSRRTAHIDKVADELGITDPDAKAKLGATTREAKQPGQSWPELVEQWHQRLGPTGCEALQQGCATARRRAPRSPVLDNAGAIDFALEHLLERASAVPENKVLTAALEAGLGRVRVEGLRRELASRALLRREIGGEVFLSTPAILAEENELVHFASAGRGRHRSLRRERDGPPGKEAEWTRLTAGQRAAIEHIWQSPDRLMLLRGAAGTGKTTLTRLALEGISVPWVVLAPTAEASRGVLRQEGFGERADTLARFLQDERFQESVRGGLIWLDEASLVGSRDLVRLMRLAEQLQARVVLAGDKYQHRSVNRGDVLTLLEEKAKLPVVEVTDILRQKGAYRAAVDLLSQGRTGEGLARLEALGWVHQAPQEQLVADYCAARQSGESCLIICPTHAAGDRLTARLRTALREDGQLTGQEHPLVRLQPLHLSEAEKARGEFAETGLVVQFHRACGNYKAGQRIEATPEILAAIKDRPAAFSLYRPGQIHLAAGDTIRLTANGHDSSGRHRLHNGATYTIAGFTDAGNVRLDNGWVLDRAFGHWIHGYTLTSQAGQGKTTDRVFIDLSADNFPALRRETLYVAVSRGRKQAAVYTDDLDAMRRAVLRTEPRVLASDLARPSLRRKPTLRQRMSRHLGQLWQKAREHEQDRNHREVSRER